MKIMLQCKECGNKFLAENSKKKFCSYECSGNFASKVKDEDSPTEKEIYELAAQLRANRIMPDRPKSSRQNNYSATEAGSIPDPYTKFRH